MGEAVQGSSFEWDFLLMTYVGSRKKARVIGDNGHFRAIVAHLVKYPFREYHEYIRVLFGPRIKLLVVALRLRGGTVKSFGDLLPMLS